jgi:hypothetical protein
VEEVETVLASVQVVAAVVEDDSAEVVVLEQCPSTNPASVQGYVSHHLYPPSVASPKNPRSSLMPAKIPPLPSYVRPASVSRHQ